jgi:transposase-like protein
MLDGLRGEDNIAGLCRREGIVQNLCYRWPKDFLEAGKKRLAGDTARTTTSDEVKELRREASALKEVVAELTLENRLLKKSAIGDGKTKNEIPPHPRGSKSSAASSSCLCRCAGHWKSSASQELLSIAGTIFITTLDPKT